MSLEVETRPEDMGMSSAQLEHLSRHLDAYVDDGRLPGVYCLVARQNKVVYLHHYGRRDIENDRPVELDTIYRFFSMSKPITSVATMQLYEQGRIKLTDAVETYIPSFADMQVWDGGSAEKPRLRPASTKMTIHHLLTHMSGLTYGFMHAHPVDTIYRKSGFDFGIRHEGLAATCDALAELPLMCDPGAAWNYSHSTDVLGRIVEVVSGKSFGQYLQDHILGPLGMVDTGFRVRDGQAHRLASNYFPHPQTGMAALLDAADTSPFQNDPTWEGGGGGLVSTMSDYHRFCQMLMNGGTLDGQRIIGRKTLQFMTMNHLPGGKDLQSSGTPLWSETPYIGVGFGLGFSVQIDPAQTQVISSPGEFAWGGAASTAFWCDPAEDLHVIFLTQLVPSSHHPIRPELKQLVYGALS